MPHRSAAAHHHSDHHGALPQCAGCSAAAAPRTPRRRADYTLLHAGRQVRLGPIAFWVVVGTLVIMAVLDPHHRHLFRLPRRRADPADRAPDRDAVRLRGPHRRTARPGRPHVEPTTPRPGTIRAEARPDRAAPDRVGIARRRAQRTVRSRLHRHGQSSRRATRHRAARPSSPRRSAARVLISLPPTTARACRAPAPTPETPKAASKATLARLQESLDRVEARQTAALQSIEENYNAKVRRMHGVLTDIGVDPNKIAPRAARRHRRTVHRRPAAGQCRRLRSPALARQRRPCAGGQADADACAPCRFANR